VSRRASIPVLGCALGLLLACHPMLLTGLGRMAADAGDTRWNNFVLERESSWIRAGADPSRFWHPGYLHPAPNAAARGDVQLATAPLYLPWRLAGLAPDTSFQLWSLGVLILDFVAGYVFLRRVFGQGVLAATAGAGLLAFGAPRTNQAGHQQLWAIYPFVFALTALHAALHGRGRWLVVAAVALVVQFWSGFYMGWFSALALAAAGACGLAHDEWRPAALDLARRHRRALGAALAVVVAGLLPLAVHHHQALADAGPRNPEGATLLSLPRLQSWFYLGPFSWVYGWQAHAWPFDTLVQDQEHRLGIGALTTVLAAAGLWSARRLAAVRLLVAASALVAVAFTVPLGFLTWPLARAVIPGALAIGAVARVGMLLLVPAAVGLGAWVQSASVPRALLLLALVALEQAQTPPSYDKHPLRMDVAALAAAVPRDCDAFLFVPRGPAPPGLPRVALQGSKHQMDALFAHLESGVPTVNGYGAQVPPDAPFASGIAVEDDAAVAVRRADLARWASAHGLRADRTCVVAPVVDWTWARPDDTLGRDLRRRSPLAGRLLALRARLRGQPPPPEE
jgi:hypothetical protein